MIDKIVLHCSDSPHGRGDDAETIHQWHKRRGWDGNGYHWVIGEGGHLQAGRPEYWTGAHVKGHNEGSIGVCLIGENGHFTNAQMRTLNNLKTALVSRYPTAKWYNHYELDPNKTCPGCDLVEIIGA